MQLGWKVLNTPCKAKTSHGPLAAGFSSAAPRLLAKALPGVVRFVLTRSATPTPANIMIGFALCTGTASLLRRSALFPSAAAVSAFRPAYPAGWPAAATLVRRSSQGVVVIRAMADGIKAPASANADDVVWREKLSREQYRILRQKGTEMGGTGEYNKFAPVEGFFKVRVQEEGAARDGRAPCVDASRTLSVR